MRGITEIMEALVSEIRAAAGVRVKVGWITEGDQAPLVTLLMQGSAIRPLDQGCSKLIYELRLQMDVWHVSPKRRDETLEKIAKHLEAAGTMRRNGWYAVKVEEITDADDGTFFRKISTLSLKAVG